MCLDPDDQQYLVSNSDIRYSKIRIFGIYKFVWVIRFIFFRLHFVSSLY